MASEAFVFDGIRTPRGRGRASGSLHRIKPVDLVIGLLDELRRRHPGLYPQQGNVGSLLGIALPAWTGILQYIDQFRGGVRGFVTPPQSPVERADTGGAR